MASVSPSSSASRVTREVRVGLEAPLAPSSILGDVSAFADVGAKLRVVEAYYLALAKYYDATVAVASEDCGDNSQGAESELNVSAISDAGSARSRRRRQRRLVQSKVRDVGEDQDFEAEPDLSYLLLVKEQYRYDARVELGQRPALGRLMACPAEWFKTGLSLSAVRCSVSVGAVRFSSAGDYDVAYVMSRVVAGHELRRGSFGALWPVLVRDCIVDKDAVVGVGQVRVRSACSSPGLDIDVARVHQPVGYCYLEIVKDSCREDAMALLGPEPSLVAVLRVSSEFFDLARLSVGTDCLPGGRMHLHRGGQHSFARVAVTALAVSATYLSSHSLGAYVMGKYEPLDALVVDANSILGALPVEVMNMLKVLADLSGLQVSDFSQGDSVIAVKTAALLDTSSKDRLRMLEAVGDCALSMVVAQEASTRGETAQQYQEARSLLSNNNHLAGLFVNSGLVDHVQFVSGVPKRGKVGAGCFEVFVALVYNAGSVESVVRLCRRVGFYSAHQPWSSVDAT